jgi:hypothetical protein
MDGNEELYRLMNEEDDFYMGDDEDIEEPTRKVNNVASSSSKNNSTGCIGVFVFFIILIFVTLKLAI